MGRVIVLSILLLVCACACHPQAPAANRDVPWISTYSDAAVPINTEPWILYKAVIVSAWRSDLEKLHQTFEAKQPLSPEQKSLLQLYKQSVKHQFFEPLKSNRVVIRVTYAAWPKQERVLSDFWEAKTQAELTRSIRLVVDKKRIAPLTVRLDDERPAGSANKVSWIVVGFHVVFEREVNGRPLLTPQTEKVHLEIEGPFEKVKFPFNVKKMIVRGELVY